MTKTVVNLFGREYHIEDLYDIAHENRLFGEDELKFIEQRTKRTYNESDERPYLILEWIFRKNNKYASTADVSVLVRYYKDTDTVGFYYSDDPQECVTYRKRKKKQFRKKDYTFRHDLGGTCVGYNMDWITTGDGTLPNEDDEYELAYDVFRGRKERLNVGEYFTMEIFGRKCLAYRNEDGIFTL